jgi:prolyl oligopeptidase
MQKQSLKAKPEVLAASSAGHYIFCRYLKDAITKVSQHDTAGKLVREIELPGPGTADGFSAKQDEKETYFTYASYVTPATIYKLDIETGRAKYTNNRRCSSSLMNTNQNNSFTHQRMEPGSP